VRPRATAPRLGLPLAALAPAALRAVGAAAGARRVAGGLPTQRHLRRAGAAARRCPAAAARGRAGREGPRAAGGAWDGRAAACARAAASVRVASYYVPPPRRAGKREGRACAQYGAPPRAAACPHPSPQLPRTTRLLAREAPRPGRCRTGRAACDAAVPRPPHGGKRCRRSRHASVMRQRLNASRLPRASSLDNRLQRRPAAPRRRARRAALGEARAARLLRATRAPRQQPTHTPQPAAFASLRRAHSRSLAAPPTWRRRSARRRAGRRAPPGRRRSTAGA
jgi:hypothetical protein